MFEKSRKQFKWDWNLVLGGARQMARPMPENEANTAASCARTRRNGLMVLNLPPRFRWLCREGVGKKREMTAELAQTMARGKQGCFCQESISCNKMSMRQNMCLVMLLLAERWLEIAAVQAEARQAWERSSAVDLSSRPTRLRQALMSVSLCVHVYTHVCQCGNAWSHRVCVGCTSSASVSNSV